MKNSLSNSMNFKIHKIDFNQTLPIRHKVLWPNKSFEYVKLPNDKEGKHFGLFSDEKLIAVISLFENKNELQFRKFATLNEYQGSGFGTKLLKFIIDLTEKEHFNKIWCNARADKANFYCKFGFKKTNKHFEKGGIKYLIMEKQITNY